MGVTMPNLFSLLNVFLMAVVVAIGFALGRRVSGRVL